MHKILLTRDNRKIAYKHYKGKSKIGFLFFPGFLLSSQVCNISLLNNILEGQPSIVAPKASPWLSPHVVTLKKWPKVLIDMAAPNKIEILFNCYNRVLSKLWNT